MAAEGRDEHFGVEDLMARHKRCSPGQSDLTLCLGFSKRRVETVSVSAYRGALGGSQGRRSLADVNSRNL